MITNNIRQPLLISMKINCNFLMLNLEAGNSLSIFSYIAHGIVVCESECWKPSPPLGIVFICKVKKQHAINHLPEYLIELTS